MNSFFQLVLNLVLAHQIVSAQQLIEADYLAPKDLGFEKRTVTTNLGHRQVLVITRVMDLESSRSWRSFVFFDANKPVSASVIVVDRSALDEAQKGKWWVRINGSGIGLHDLGKLSSRYDGKGTLEYTFCPLNDREGYKSRIIVRAEVASYKDVVARGAELPKMTEQGGWTFEFGNTFHNVGQRGWTQELEWKPKEIEEAEKKDSQVAILKGEK